MTAVSVSAVETEAEVGATAPKSGAAAWVSGVGAASRRAGPAPCSVGTAEKSPVGTIDDDSEGWYGGGTGLDDSGVAGGCGSEDKDSSGTPGVTPGLIWLAVALELALALTLARSLDAASRTCGRSGIGDRGCTGSTCVCVWGGVHEEGVNEGCVWELRSASLVR